MQDTVKFVVYCEANSMWHTKLWSWLEYFSQPCLNYSTFLSVYLITFGPVTWPIQQGLKP